MSRQLDKRYPRTPSKRPSFRQHPTNAVCDLQERPPTPESPSSQKINPKLYQDRNNSMHFYSTPNLAQHAMLYLQFQHIVIHHNRTLPSPPPPPNHLLTSEFALPAGGRLLLALARGPRTSSSPPSPPIHLGFLMSWNHLGVSNVSIVFLNRCPSISRKFSSSSGSSNITFRGPPPDLLADVFATGRVLGDVPRGVAGPPRAPPPAGRDDDDVLGTVMMGALLPAGLSESWYLRPGPPALRPLMDAEVPLSSRSIRSLPSRHDPVP